MRIIYTLALSLLTLTLFGQQRLVVKYEYVVERNIDKVMETINSEAEGNIAGHEIKKALLEAMNRKTNYILWVSKDESEFKKEERIMNEQPSDSGIMVSIEDDSGELIYKNLKEGIYLNPVDSFGKDILVEDSLKIYDWKITRESREILGQEVRKATAQDDKKRITAWYAPKLTIKNGPGHYHSLPGLILEIEEVYEMDGEVENKSTYRAVSLEIDEEPKELKRPNKGKKMTRKEFETFSKESYEKYKEMRGGGVDKD